MSANDEDWGFTAAYEILPGWFSQKTASTLSHSVGNIVLAFH
jgi:hypothetical protein